MGGYREGRGALSTGRVICHGLGDFTYRKIEKKMLVFSSNFGLKWFYNVPRKKRQFAMSHLHTSNLSPWAQREPPIHRLHCLGHGEPKGFRQLR